MNSRYYWLWLGFGLVVLGALARFYHLGFQSLWLDEIGEGSAATLPMLKLLATVRGHAAAAPLDYLGVKLATHLLGHGTEATRTVAFLAGVFAVAAIGWVGYEVTRSRAVALGSMCLLALAPMHIAYSQEARPYALAFLLGCVSIALLARALRLRLPFPST